MELIERMMRDLVRLRRRAADLRAEPPLAISDMQTVECIPVHEPRGFDAAKCTRGCKRVMLLLDADGNWLVIAVAPASVQERDSLPALGTGRVA